jgi:hypothetical protein
MMSDKWIDCFALEHGMNSISSAQSTYCLSITSPPSRFRILVDRRPLLSTFRKTPARTLGSGAVSSQDRIPHGIWKGGGETENETKLLKYLRNT